VFVLFVSVFAFALFCYPYYVNCLRFGRVCLPCVWLCWCCCYVLVLYVLFVFSTWFFLFCFVIIVLNLSESDLMCLARVFAVRVACCYLFVMLVCF